jgi:hypothetical protein
VTRGERRWKRKKWNLLEGLWRSNPIGVVRSVIDFIIGNASSRFLLAPHIEDVLNWRLPKRKCTASTVEGLEEFSHIWILFVFHLNTMGKNGRVSAKISPRALGDSQGQRLCLTWAHRFARGESPWRDWIGFKSFRKHCMDKSLRRRYACISGLNLVDGDAWSI